MSQKTVLVIDDEPDNITFVESVLMREGYSVVSARNGLDGLHRAAADLPDLILLDVQMPKMNGFEVFNQLRAAEATRRIPVIMLTGIREKIGRGYSAHDMEAFFGEAPRAYLEKPVSPEALLEAVRSSL